MKPEILYLSETGGVEEFFPDLFNKPRRVHNVDEVRSLAVPGSIIVFGGGQDICPKFYGAKISRHSGANQDVQGRDKIEQEIFHWAVQNKIGMLGICRGSQLLCALSGGKLVQHCERHGASHRIMTHDGRKIMVTSTHHQMMYPWGVNHKLIAWSDPARSYYYVMDDDNILATVPEYKEPEIVFFPDTRALAIQGHPEYSNATQQFRQYTHELVKEFLCLRT